MISGGLKRGWKLVRLKFVADFRSGRGITSSEIAESGEYPVFGGNGIRGYCDSYTHEGQYLLIGRQGALCGNVHLAGGRFWASEHAVVVRANKADVRWLGRLLTAMNLNQYSISAAQPGLAVDRIRELSIPQPPIRTQTAIANFLDRKTAAIDALIEKKERLIELLAEKRAALIHSLLANSEATDTKLSYVVDLLPGFAFPSDGYVDAGNAIPLLRGINIAPGYLRWEDVVRWPAEKLNHVEKWKLREDDIVLGLDRPWISSGLRVAQVSEDDCPSLLLQRVARIRCGKSILPGFLLLLFSWERFRHHVEPDSTGVSVPHISPGQVLSYRVPLPPVVKQAEIVRRFRSHESRLVTVSQLVKVQLENLKEYRQALITAAVTGQLDIPGVTS